jgi:hypothetical protein
MVMPTPDSPAGATGLGEAVGDFIRDNAGPDDNSQWAISEYEGQDADQDSGYDGEYVSEADDYDSVADDILGLGQQDDEYDDGHVDPNPVPYERFREVNERARQAAAYEDRLNRWGRVIEQLESQGFQDADQVDQMLAKQQQEAQENAIRYRYQQLADSQMLDPALAQAQQEAEIMKLRYEQQMQQVQGYMSMQQRDAAYQQFPLAQRAPELVDNLIDAGWDPYQATQAVHNQVQTLTRSLVPEIASRMQSSRRNPQPMGQGQVARATPTGGGNGQQQSSGWGALLGIRRGRGTL